MFNVVSGPSRKLRTRVVALGLVATALVGGFVLTNVVKADAAPVKDCQVETPDPGAKHRITDPNSGIQFTNLYWCQTQKDAYVFPPTTDQNVDTIKPFGLLKAHTGEVTKVREGNYFVCWSSSMSTKLSKGYYMMLTEADEPVKGQEQAYDLDWNKPNTENKPDASADRFGWVSSEILGIKAGERPKNIAECGSAPVGSKVVDPTLKKATTTSTTSTTVKPKPHPTTKAAAQTSAAPAPAAKPAVDCAKYLKAPTSTNEAQATKEFNEATDCFAKGRIMLGDKERFREHRLQFLPA